MNEVARMVWGCQGNYDKALSFLQQRGLDLSLVAENLQFDGLFKILLEPGYFTGYNFIKMVKFKKNPCAVRGSDFNNTYQSLINWKSVI